MRKHRTSWNCPQNIQRGVSFIPAKLLFILVHIHFGHVYKQTLSHKAEKSWSPAIWCQMTRLRSLGSFQARLSHHKYLPFLWQWLCSPTLCQPMKYCTTAHSPCSAGMFGQWAEVNCFLRQFPSSDFSLWKGYAQIKLPNEFPLPLFLKHSVDVCFPYCHPEIHSTIWIFHWTLGTIRTCLQGTENYFPLISIPKLSQRPLKPTEGKKLSLWKENCQNN